MRRILVVLAALLAAPTATAHGDLEINELETLAIRDFEGQEDSFAWEGFEIWDVYVGEGYNESYDSDGVYLKVNFAGDGTQRPTGGAAWTISISFNVGEETFERELTHDGTTISTSFESLQWMIADGNVLQIKAWVPVKNWTGKSVTDIVIVSSVDGEPRDTAPGGVHAPGTGDEIPIEAPSTGIFPPMGEGRIVDEVPLTGAEKFLNVTIEPKGNDTFAITVTNVLEEQGQHVFLRADPGSPWTLATETWGHNLEGAASGTFEVNVKPKAREGSEITPLALDFVSDIGGHRTLYAFLGGNGVEIVEQAEAATPRAIESEGRSVGAAQVVGILAAATVALWLRRT